MQSTTPVDPRVLDAMMPYFTGIFFLNISPPIPNFLKESYGNPHSKTHDYGKEAMDVVEVAREVN